MKPDRIPGDELAEYRRDPPPAPSSGSKNEQEVERMKQQLDEWVTRNRGYLMSPDFLNLYRLPSISPLWGYDESYYRHCIVHELAAITQLGGRRLTPNEMALHLDAVSRAVVAKSYDRPIAIAATLFMINRGWKEYTFPFYQPTTERFNPHFFPRPSHPLLRGRIAAASWQGLRCGLYGGLGFLAYHVLAPKYHGLCDSQVIMALAMEPHLKGLRDDVAGTLERLSRTAGNRRSW
ncbi:hypothetical protein B0H67DRAFT_583043 [Lasiosphaeris hirsuta]|uniref:Uncharacterized protein n=1 Tax=Lasiosphaeris hirsuta TaxID=260670 RepID=A0AA40A7H4_9PEZI|nr:hypothetical protein B0H67DRAFT_583043 [Lasiosphaeris hirsuta]